MVNAVEFANVSRLFGDVKAVDNVSIKIKNGEFFSMPGQSDSGKTTCLRLIAGFEQLTSGSLLIHGKDAHGLAPYQRDVNTVFQDYALVPHMRVLENVAYGLMVKGLAKKSAARPRYGSAGARWSVNRAFCCLMNRWTRWISSCVSRCKAN